MGLEQQREIPFQEAAVDWYDEVFSPIVSLINKRNLLKHFPDRTATDLYLWISEHRAGLMDHLGWEVGQEDAINNLSELHGQGSKNLFRNIINKTRKIVAGTLGSGPPPGTWRERLAGMSVLKHLFNDLIVALDDSKNAWNALEMAIQLSGLEDSHIHGIHIHPLDRDPQLTDHQRLKDSFRSHCQESGVNKFNFIISSGDIGTILCDHSRFADLILLPLNNPPGESPIQRLGSGLAKIIRNCPVPILTVSDAPRGTNSIILAFDGSPKSWEAMYIAAYFGSQHGSEITVLTSSVGSGNPETILDQAKSYLARFPARCTFLLTDQPVPQAIAALQEEGKADLVMIGGYGGNLFKDVVLGSVVDSVLREIQLPILICR
jgi:nucleotide-binding universal stress UspA family protein